MYNSFHWLPKDDCISKNDHILKTQYYLNKQIPVSSIILVTIE